ncbi:ribose ABC transporter permease [Mycolicibacterium wolinskyi]|uniref:Ribose ABC transporter permease n=1 Tax=Mycolicibacterium wolinskyi TaxID=59750 RepID=A0A132PJX5_9MYCO|nr:ribose ABC transporter permease [Mycolicibacterium wolinskyi]KWX22636.1 ribose ABC transporter permease [Mycolicibacterium wolinskyi]
MTLDYAPPPTTARPANTVDRLRSGMLSAADRLGVAGALIALVLLFAVVAPNFATPDNLLDVARQISVTAILGAGLTFVIITAGIDLSVGSAVGVTAFVGVALALNGFPAALAILGAVLTGVVIGAVNGLLVAWVGLASFIVTLAALTYLRGITYVGTDGTTMFSTTLNYARLGHGSLFGIPIPVLIMVAVFGIGWYVLNRTVFGRWVTAVGGNAEAARLAGIPVKRVLVSVYVISGLCAAIGGVIASARLQSAVPDLGAGYELSAIAAVVLGGTSLMGGRGSLVGTLIGAAIIGVLINGMTLLDVSSFYQQIIQGIVIVLAVALDRLRTRGAAKEAA